MPRLLMCKHEPCRGRWRALRDAIQSRVSTNLLAHEHASGTTMQETSSMAPASLSTIYNMLPLADDLGTAGQPTSAQFAAIKAAGYDVVINLATGKTPRDLPNEADVVAAQGMEYIHIPVVWEHPTEADLACFFEAMDATQHKKRFVHCIANMRVSAFVFLYRVLRQGMPVEEARATMAKIWQPNPVWHQFINDALVHGQRQQHREA